MIPWSSKLKPVHASLSCFFFYYYYYNCHCYFCCYHYLGFLVFCFSLQLSTLNLQYCGEKPWLNSTLRWDVAGISSQPRLSPGLQLAIITIDLKLYLALIYTLVVNKVLPHFISEVDKCIICLLFRPLSPILNCEICDLFKRWVNHSLVCMSS